MIGTVEQDGIADAVIHAIETWEHEPTGDGPPAPASYAPASYLVSMTSLRRLAPAPVFLLAALVAGQVVFVPALVALAGDAHVVSVSGDGSHRDIVLRHAEHAPHETAADTWDRVCGHAALDEGVEPHPDHTFHLPDLVPVVVGKGMKGQAALVAVLLPSWTRVERIAAVRPHGPEPAVPVPDGALAALRTTVLLV